MKNFLRFIFTLFLATSLTSCATLGKPVEEPQPKSYIYPEQFIEVNGVKMCYVEQGEGTPIIFIHGLMGGVYTWQDNMPGLSKKYKVVAIDLPGFGKSQKGDLPYTIDFFEAVLRDFIVKKKYDHPVIAGISLGGHLALTYAVEHPDELKGIIVVGSTGGGRKFTIYENILIQIMWHEWVVARYITETGLKRIWDRQFSVVNEKTDRAFADLPQFHDGTRAHGEYIHTFSKTLRSILYDPLKTRYPDIKTPTLIVWGKKDYYHHIEDAYEMNHLIPNSQLRVFDNAGHTIMQEEVEAFNEAVDQFITHPDNSAP